MRVTEARDVAKRWVSESASHIPGFRGAFTAGSTNWLSPDSDVPRTSDADVVVVLDNSHTGERRKFMWQGVLLDVSYLPGHRLQSIASVLGDYHVAPNFSSTTILLDPSGHLATLLTGVRRDYAKLEWIRRRCADARDKVLRHLNAIPEDAPLHDQVMSWLFGAGVTTHVLLTAGLRNPTIRTRYVAVQQLLTEHRRRDVHEMLLDVLGVADWSRDRVARHLATLTAIFDRAIVSGGSVFPFAADMSPSGREAAIDGSRELMERGFHREAVFWIAVSHCRCQKVISDDAFTEGYLDLVGDLRLHSAAQLRRRRAEVESILPSVCEVAEAIAADVAE